MKYTELKAIKVFFDGQCPLCCREINFYKQQEGADTIDWIDITNDDLSTLPSDVNQDVAMSRFHVVTAEGNLVSGGKAFSSLWLSLPKFGWAGRLFKHSLFALILEVAYRVFLSCRPLLQRILKLILRHNNCNLTTNQIEK